MKGFLNVGPQGYVGGSQKDSLTPLLGAVHLLSSHVIRGMKIQNGSLCWNSPLQGRGRAWHHSKFFLAPDMQITSLPKSRGQSRGQASFPPQKLFGCSRRHTEIHMFVKRNAYVQMYPAIKGHIPNSKTVGIKKTFTYSAC